jgi:serine/threonine kinase 32
VSSVANLLTDSFKVFDYSRAQRRSYYHPAGPSTAPLQSPVKVSRPGTPSDRTGVISKTGLDVEAQILDGGGMANMGGRGWRSEDDTRESVELRSIRNPTPLRASET